MTNDAEDDELDDMDGPDIISKYHVMCGLFTLFCPDSINLLQQEWTTRRIFTKLTEELTMRIKNKIYYMKPKDLV